MLNTFRVASYRPDGQGEAGYEATKTGAYGANRYQYHPLNGVIA